MSILLALQSVDSSSYFLTTPKENDRPPVVVGIVGRQSGEVRLEVVEHADQATLEELVKETTIADATVYTDEWNGYNHLPELGRKHATVCHTPGQRLSGNNQPRPEDVV